VPACGLNWTALVDRPLTDDVQRHDRRRRLLQVALPLLVVAFVILSLPGWLRPAISRERLRTARVTAGPIESAIMATGTVVPEVERVLSSPLDARVPRTLVRPGV
jgi:HlyD family secretion protein